MCSCTSTMAACGCMRLYPCSIIARCVHSSRTISSRDVCVQYHRMMTKYDYRVFLFLPITQLKLLSLTVFQVKRERISSKVSFIDCACGLGDVARRWEKLYRSYVRTLAYVVHGWFTILCSLHPTHNTHNPLARFPDRRIEQMLLLFKG